MKKQLLIFIILLIVINSYGQTESKLKFGIKTGLAFASIKRDYNNTSSKIKTKTGFTAGGFLDVTLNKNLVFQPALLYVRKGGNEFSGYGYSIPFNLNYLELPLNILYQSSGVNGVYFLGGGLSPALHLNSAYDGNEVKDFDIGISLLAGYKVPIGFSVNLGYTHGLTNVTSDKEIIKTIRNRYFSITAGYEF